MWICVKLWTWKCFLCLLRFLELIMNSFYVTHVPICCKWAFGWLLFEISLGCGSNVLKQQQVSYCMKFEKLQICKEYSGPKIAANAIWYETQECHKFVRNNSGRSIQLKRTFLLKSHQINLRPFLTCWYMRKPVQAMGLWIFYMLHIL